MVNEVAWSTPLRNGPIAATLAVSDGSITLRIERNGRVVVADMRLGIAVDAVDLDSDSTVIRFRDEEVAERWTSRSGKARGEHDFTHRERVVELLHRGSERKWTIRIRVSRDGVAIRYGMPDLQGLAALTADRTCFPLASFDRAWVLEYQTWYETPRVGIDIGDLPSGDYGFPFLVRSHGGDHVLVSESGIDGRYSGAHPVVGDDELRTLRVELADESTEIARGEVTPWRVFMVGSLAEIVESLFVDELAPAARPDLAEAGWVRPGRAAWSWWSNFYSGAQLEHQRRFVDAAAELSWEHLLIDCGWEETWVPEIVAYASRYGIQVHLWTVWHDLDGPEKLGKLALWRSWGVAGIKVDFMESESKDRYRWYDTVLQETARLGLMVNFHGSVIPRGWARTWPQVIGYEAIRGSEYYVFFADTPLTAEHNVIQPFTRNVVGAMDFTPVAFTAPGRVTSDGHELALSVAFECGITHFADDVDVYLSKPLVARFLAELAPAWDETILLSGTPDTEAVVARRSGDRWFVGCISSGSARTIHVPLDRLGLTNAQAWIVSDDVEGGTGLVESVLSNPSSLNIAVAPSGGFVAIIADAGTDIFRSRPRAVSATPIIDPVVIELNETRDAVLTVSAGATLRVPPGWGVTRESDGRWRVRAPHDILPGALGIVTAELAGEGGTPLVAHSRVYVPLAEGAYRASGLPMLSFTNESGPVERDQSNGGGNPNDGVRMSLSGQNYDDGFGVSTPSSIQLHLGGRASRFTAEVGVDDETPSTSAIVSLHGDGRELFVGRVDSGALPLLVEADVSDVGTLTLSTREVAEGDNSAHVDWASARLIVTSTVRDNVTPHSGH